MIGEGYFFITKTPRGNYSLRWYINSRCIRFQAKQNKYKTGYEVNHLLRFRDRIIYAVNNEQNGGYVLKEALALFEAPATQIRDCTIVRPSYRPEPPQEVEERPTILELMKANRQARGDRI